MLLALFDENHVSYERARLWWKSNQQGGWASCPLTENGFVRIISQPTYPSRLVTSEALDLLRRQQALGNHTFWQDDISMLDVERFDHAQIIAPKQLTDIYLLALAVRHDGCFVTFDRAISLAAVKGAEARHLVVI